MSRQQIMPSGHRPIVRSVTTLEHTTGQTGTTSYRFSRGWMTGGAFLGFRNLTQTESLNGVETSREFKTFWLTLNQQPLVSESEIHSDRDLCFAPGIGGAGCVASFDRRQVISRHLVSYGLHQQFLLPSTMTVTEYGEESGSSLKRREYVYGYDDFGNLTSFRFDGAGTPALARHLAVTYARNSGETTFKQATLQLTSGTQVLEDREFYYDSNAAVTDALTRGFLTKSRLCLSPQFPATSTCGSGPIGGWTQLPADS